MPTDNDLSKALVNARTGLTSVINDISTRPDYNKRPELKTTSDTLTKFQQDLLIAEAQPELSVSNKAALKAEASNEVTPAITALIDSNIVMTNMGPLNTSRTITPTMAQEHNVKLEAELAAVQQLIAKLSVEPSPQQANLVHLEVSGAEKTSGGLYYQAYQPGQCVRIRAVIEPDTPSAHSEINWVGGSPDFSGAANLRDVLLGNLTTPGSPTKVTAMLGGKSLAVEVAVVPNILGLDVSGANSDGDNKWSVDPADDTQTVVRAVVEPDTQAAYKFLKWQGGKTDDTNPYDRRLLPADAFKDPSKPVPVEVEVNLG